MYVLSAKLKEMCILMIFPLFEVFMFVLFFYPLFISTRSSTSALMHLSILAPTSLQDASSGRKSVSCRGKKSKQSHSVDEGRQVMEELRNSLDTKESPR